MHRSRVVVGMSGGVDSSVAAAILKEKGYEVIGLTMQISAEASRCCSDADVKDARRVAKALDIPHYVISMHEPFQRKVIDYFVSEYEKGRTPNPCAVCNPAIKFGDLLDKALALDAQHIATGHYAIIRKDRKTGRYLLKRGKERGKDQSYFLARLSQKALSHSLFPVGTYTKPAIREMAEKYGLPVAQKSESQEACFIPEAGVVPFIEAQRGGPYPPGPIKNTEGEILGAHRGIIGYTIGQRKGLGIALGKPAYVVRIDAAKNTIIVGDDDQLDARSFICSDAHWIAIEKLKEPCEVHARIRYMHKPAKAMIEPLGGNRVRVTFKQAQRAITPGQLAVFYRGESVLGSAWIDEVFQ